MNFQNMTPSQIDTLLAPINGKFITARSGMYSAERSIENYARSGRKAPAYLAGLVTKCQTEMEAAKIEMAPFHAEYDRRGGWTRFFMVMNNGGHLHRSTHCSTCRPTTQFAWMPEYSGSNEAEIIDIAGSDSCTICFPNAPVEKRSMLPFRIVEREEAAKLAAEKAEKQAAKLAKAINLDGSEWKVREFGMHENFKTIRSVELAIFREMDYVVYYGDKDSATAAIQMMATKLSERTGKPAGDIISEFQAKVNKKHKIKA